MPSESRKCGVVSCDVRKGQMFTFRTNKVLREKWLRNVANSDYFNLTREQLKHRRVCVKHFEKRFLRKDGKLVRFAYPTLITEEEIERGKPHKVQEDDSVIQPEIDHNYCTKEIENVDHTYASKEQKPIRIDNYDDNTQNDDTLQCLDATFNDHDNESEIFQLEYQDATVEVTQEETKVMVEPQSQKITIELLDMNDQEKLPQFKTITFDMPQTDTENFPAIFPTIESLCSISTLSNAGESVAHNIGQPVQDVREFPTYLFTSRDKPIRDEASNSSPYKSLMPPSRLVPVCRRPRKTNPADPSLSSFKVLRTKGIPSVDSTFKKYAGIWDHFREVDKNFVKCLYCHKYLSIVDRSTGNLNRHMKLKHPKIEIAKRVKQAEEHQQHEHFNDKPIPFLNEASSIFNEVPSASPANLEIQENFASNHQFQQQNLFADIETPKPKKYKVLKSIDEQLVKLLVKDFISFETVESVEFIKLFQLACPTYQVPSKEMVSHTLIPCLYEDVKEKVKKTLDKIDTACLTADRWSLNYNQNLLAMFVHYVNKNCEFKSFFLGCIPVPKKDTRKELSLSLKGFIKNWNLDSKIIAVVGDTNHNVVAAIRMANLPHLPSLSHILDSIVQTCFKSAEINHIVSKIKKIVKYFKSNKQASIHLKSVQMQLDLPDPKLKDVSDQWTSTLNMLRSVLILKDAIISTMSVMHSQVNYLTTDEWEMLQKIVEVLEIFEKIMNELTSNKLVLRSKEIILIQLINRNIFILKNMHDTPTEVQKFIQSLKEQLEKKFKGIETNEICSQCTLLDPRYKNLGFSQTKYYDRVYNALKKKVSGFSIDKKGNPLDTPEIVNEPDDLTEPTYQCEQIEYCKVTKDKKVKTPLNSGVIELNKYLEESLLDQFEDPLSWWYERRTVYPRLYYLMQRRLVLVATTVSCKKVFTKVRQTFKEKNSRLDTLKINEIVFLNYNL